MNKKKAISLVLAAALVLVVVLSGCSSGNNNDAPSNAGALQPTSGSENAEASAPSAAPADPLGKYDPPIEVSVIRPYDENVKFIEGESATDNVWTRNYEEGLGVKVKYEWTLQGPIDQYYQKLNVSIASNDLADIMTVNSGQLKQLAEAGQLADLTDIYQSYASDFTKKIFSDDGGVALSSATFGGKLLGLPRLGSDIDEVPLLWVRKDWLAKLNLPDPKTMADVEKIAEAFASQDPDGNGKADTYGLGLSKDLNGGFPGFEGFLNGYHAYYNTWLKDASGQIVNSNIQPEMKTALAALQKLYAAKAIDKEFGTRDGGKVAEAVTSGKLGMYYGAMWTPIWPIQDGRNLDPSMQWEPYLLPSVDGQPAIGQVPFDVPSGQYYVVRKDAKHPEAALKMMNFFYDRIHVNKPETTDSKYDGIETFKYVILAGAPITENLDVYRKAKKLLEANDMEGLKSAKEGQLPLIAKYLEGDEKNWGYYKVFGPEGSYKVIEQMLDQSLFLRSEYFGPPTPTMGEKNSTLETLMKETFTKIIMGAAGIDEFDKFVSDWKKLGGDQITKEVNEWAASR
ncbi:extracellular solute-binding protein [Paenibacillus sp. PAMC21692]|uniref:extracellular solute-binding protein n=1 Tax=Paenibacillus sp. PAMC21692 TaxID=2762320 RepID=UPI00164CE27A|nr:extracellular solute-binding protein [Paenibacillus sp. PAMC21692]QNK58875.1 extracellular solute-binding protein [Paenibacillus sp. PAMC21692]